MPDVHPRMAPSSEVHSDRAPERHRPEHNSNISQLLDQITPQDWRSAQARFDNDRSRSANNLGLPQIQIIDGRPFDRNHDGNLTTAELETSLRDPRAMNAYPGADAAAVGLRSQFRQIAALNPDLPDVITGRDIDRLHHLPQDNWLARRVQNVMSELPNNGRNEGLFDRVGGVIPDAVRQGHIGDCSLMSVLTSLASNERGRQFILQMVQPDGDQFRVRFGNGQTITTERPTPQDMAVYALDSRHGIWPNVVELAFGQARSDDQVRPRAATERLFASDVLATLFGHRGTRRHLEMNSLSDDALHSRLSSIGRNAMVMVADTVLNPTANVERFDSHGRQVANTSLDHRHSYAVDHYDANGRLVYLRNPWLGGELLRLPLGDFRRNFMTFDSVQP